MNSAYNLRACIILKDHDEIGDAIILPEYIFKDIEHRLSADGLFFRIENKKNGRTVVGSLLEFSRDEKMVQMPNWMFQDLNCETFDFLSVSIIKIPKATKMNIEIDGVSEEAGIKMSEFQNIFQKYKAVKKGEHIPFQVGGFSGTFFIKDCQPNDYVSLINTDCEFSYEYKESQKKARNEQSQKEKIPLQVGSPFNGVVNNKNQQFVFEVDQQTLLSLWYKIQVEVKDPSLDLNIYVSRKEVPSPFLYETRNITIQNPKVHYCALETKKDPFYITLVAEPSYQGSGAFCITVEPSEEETVMEYSKRNERVIINEEEKYENCDEDHFYCSHCHKLILKNNYAIHNLTHKRRKYCSICHQVIQEHEVSNHTHCELCKQMVPLNEQEKHILLCHFKHPCPECGQKIAYSSYRDHRERVCPMRNTSCPYCQASIQKRKLDEHVEKCGSRMICCYLCSKRIMYRNMVRHMQMMHSKREVDLADYIARCEEYQYNNINDLDQSYQDREEEEQKQNVNHSSHQEEMNNLIPCEYCHRKIPFSNYMDHVATHLYH